MMEWFSYAGHAIDGSVSFFLTPLHNIVEALAHGEPAELTAYPDALRDSWVWEELSSVRNIRPAFAKWGMWGGLLAEHGAKVVEMLGIAGSFLALKA